MRSFGRAVLLAQATAAIAFAAQTAPSATGELVAADVTPQPIHPDIPDRLCVDKESPFFNEAVAKQIGVRFNGKVRKNDVREYCISEGWVSVEIRNAQGRPKVERGEYLTQTLQGVVEPFFK